MSNATCPVLSAAGFIGTAAASSAAWSYESTGANPCVKVPGVDAWISILCDPRECEIGDKMDKWDMWNKWDKEADWLFGWLTGWQAGGSGGSAVLARVDPFP